MIQMDGGDRVRMTLLDRMSTVETNRSSSTGLTLEAILLADKNTTSPQPPSNNQSNRTLLDVMQRDHRHDDRHNRDKTTWETLREKLRLKRNATVWISSNPIPTLDNPIPTRDNVSHQLGFLLSTTGNVTEEVSSVEGRVQLGAVLAEERALSAREEETQLEREVEPARMSLMELLEENEGQISLVSVDGEAEEVAAAETVAVAEISCCVCMKEAKERRLFHVVIRFVGCVQESFEFKEETVLFVIQQF
ncbi:unnamed protein product [Arabidopsis lyrata]|nr:unnamed protein product [Arabidopsis lyrata]